MNDSALPETASSDSSRYIKGVFPGGLQDSELFWRNHQPWLEKHGYRTYDFKRYIDPRGRTRHPVKYYYIDFDLCERYDSASGPPRKMPIFGGDISVPEFRRHPDQSCDPFAVDVYRIGNLIRMCIAECSPAGEPLHMEKVQFGGEPIREPFNPALAFMESLINDMTQDDPEK
ncbi:hypothetical protein Moror_13048 [Moniliophthora roreri MCA 2997]|uniref:Uncharacterized protein n=2 Tax=Moniliophthora roreri TaxID=221103 RepID=V2XMY2_MONRO|nr:hypothetical protein Moror_13048 [Moniliophthora roreri MCA 2997]